MGNFFGLILDPKLSHHDILLDIEMSKNYSNYLEFLDYNGHTPLLVSF